MEKDIWKWVFQQLEEDKLSELCKKIPINVPGFRKGASLPPRSLVITQLLKPKNLNKIATIKIVLNEEIELTYPLVSMDEQDLLAIADLPPSLILHKLLSEQEIEKARFLFDRLLEGNGEKGFLKLEDERKEAMKKRFFDNESAKDVPTETNLSSEQGDRKWEKIQKKLDHKIQTLLDRADKIQSEYSTFREEQNKRHQADIKALQQAKSEYGIVLKQSQNNALSFQKEKDEWQKEKKYLLEQIAELEKERSWLHASLLQSQMPKKAEQDEQSLSKKKKIFLLGNPHNNSIFKNCPFDVTVIEREQLEKMDYSHCQEIWGLTYKLDPQVILNIQEQVSVTIKRIETFQQLRKEIEKGCEEHEKQKVGI